MKYKMTNIIGCCLLGLFLITGAFVIPAVSFADTEGYSAEECMECHSSEAEESSLTINPEMFAASAHGQKATCVECHTSIKGDEHMEGEGVEPVNCSNCHETKTEKNGLFSMFSTSRIASHKKADFGKNYNMDNCLGCHQGAGAHGETEAIVDQDCNKCHDPGLKNAMWGYMHADTAGTGVDIAFTHLLFAAFIVFLLFGRFLMPNAKK
jgi:hypothetical protein